MNKTFLEHVAKDILSKYGHNLSRIAVVFPNKRASLFLNQNFTQLVDEPIWTPKYMTISELFRDHSPLTVADPIKLICDLHKSFVKCTDTNETIDHFYGWGQLMLADFDDIDKNMADADMIFRNINDLHELDDTSYLTEEQRDILRKFFANFTPDNESELKARFMSLWQHFAEIYHDFNSRLEAQGLAYEGALYRKVADDESAAYEYDAYLFVGFNLLQTVEKKLFTRLLKDGKAHFYWDFDDYYMPHGNDTHHEAGHFIAQYLEHFPNELDTHDAAIYDNLSRLHDIRFVSAPTDTVQATYIAPWIKSNDRIHAGRHTAIVMCDEHILQAVMHALPDEVTEANITTGFPLQQTSVTSFVAQLINLQTYGHPKGSDKYMLHSVLKVLRHPYAILVSEETQRLIGWLNDNKRYFPSRRELCVDEGTSLLFGDIGCYDKDGEDFNISLFAWLQKILRLIGTNSDNDDALFTESVFRMYTLVSRMLTLMQCGDLRADLSTISRLFSQLISATSIPFHGEPVEGIQVMGVLETRNLDFDHLLILSCNEGNMPKGVNDSSFIPYSIRKAYGLTTIDHKVAIYAYYFYRMLQRSTDVTIAYTIGNDFGKSGERSRFMTQLMVESNAHIHNLSLQAEHATACVTQHQIDKTEEMMTELHAIKTLAPTAINRYICCPLRFYYSNIAHIHEYEDDEDIQMDNRIFGNIFHKAVEIIYGMMCDDGKNVTAAAIAKMLKQPQTIERVVDEAFAEELFKASASGFKPEYNGLQLINRAVIISYIRNLLQLDIKNTPFRIIGLEIPVATQLQVSVGDRQQTVNIGGTIDRFDAATDSATGEPCLRVIDYKTGKEATLAIKDIDMLFANKNIYKSHSNYFLQAMLYSLTVSDNKEFNPNGLKVRPALLFIQHTQREGYDPSIEIGKEKVYDAEMWRTEFMERLHKVVADIYNPDVPFTPTTETDNCLNCPYSQLCKI